MKNLIEYLLGVLLAIAGMIFSFAVVAIVFSPLWLPFVLLYLGLKH